MLVGQTDLWAQTRGYLRDPLALREHMARSPTWLQSLPNQPMIFLVARVAEFFRSFNRPGLK
eukprot:10469631-Lingulodinium_polyedra.AAC.1